MTGTAKLYDGGYQQLMRFLERRQRPFTDTVAMLPDTDVDLAPMLDRITPPPRSDFKSAPRYSAERKWLELQVEFQGQPEIFHLHAMLIAISRRNDPPHAALTLFFRIWDEHGDHMASHLPVRWMISTCTSFADIGRTGDQRACGMGLSTMFDLIKLHDSERRLSGQPGKIPFRFGAGRKRFPIPFKMPPYSLGNGDLDKVLLARLWQLCEREKTIQPLGFAMLRMVMADPRSIFGRVQQIKHNRAQRLG